MGTSFGSSLKGAGSTPAPAIKVPRVQNITKGSDFMFIDELIEQLDMHDKVLLQEAERFYKSNDRVLGDSTIKLVNQSLVLKDKYIFQWDDSTRNFVYKEIIK